MKDIKCYKGLGFNTFFLLGAIATYISAVMPVIRESLGLSYAQVGTVFAGKSTGFFVGAFLSGILIDRIGTKKPLFFSFFVFPIGVLIFAFSQSAFGLITGSFLIGIGAAFLEVSIPPLSSVFQGKSGKLLNLIHAFFALGAMLSPFVASILIANQIPYAAFMVIIAGFACIPLYFSIQLNIHIPKKEKDIQKESADGYVFLFKNKLFWLIIIAIFFYVGSEVGVSSWASSYAADYRHYSMALSSLLPSIFWIGLLIGRFISSELVDRVGQLRWLIIITSVGIPITFFSQVPLDSFVFLSLFICLSGLVHASIFPTLQSILVDTLKVNIGLALSLFSGAASIGSMVASFLIGTISNQYGIQTGYFVPFIMFSGVFGMMMVFLKVSKKTD